MMNKKHSTPFSIKIKRNSSRSVFLMKKIHFNKGAVLCYAFAIVAKSTISRGKLNFTQKAKTSTPILNRAFFIRDFRIPQKSGACRFFSMVGRNRHAFSVAAFLLWAVFHPVTPYRPNCGKFSGSSSIFTKGLSAMINSNQGIIRLYSKNSSQIEFDTNSFHFKKCAQICYISHAVAKSTAEPANSNNRHMANSSTPLTRAFFVRSTRTPKERHKKACSSMVACNGKGSPFAAFHVSQFCSPLHVTAQTLQSLAVTLQKSSHGVTQMYQFIFAAIRRTDLTNQIHKIRISATSELEARKALSRDFVLVLAGRINLQNNAKTDRTFSNQCLPVIENGCNIRGTTNIDGKHDRYLSAIFLPQIHTNNTAQNGAFCSFIEFAVRLRDRTKALSTNKIRRSISVVDTLPLPKQGDTSNTKNIEKNPMKTPQNPTALYAEIFPIVSTSNVMGVSYAN